MKKIIITILLTVLAIPSALAQKTEGMCGDETKWTHDGITLYFTNVSKKGMNTTIPDYDVKNNPAPWIKKNLNIKRIQIGQGITKIGSCAFANCKSLQEVVFEGTEMREIGWGAFLNCGKLRTISLPVQLREIGTIAFAKCSQILSVKIPEHCRVGDQAFMSCTKLNFVEVGSTAELGHYVFATETNEDGKVGHTLYNGEISNLPQYVNLANCAEYGFSKQSVENYINHAQITHDENYNQITSIVDEQIPIGSFTDINSYALIIGNQNYRFVGSVPYAIHDARIFSEYCKMTLGLPAENIHLVEDATKQMIQEEELEDWIAQIPDREGKKLIVYYAGHGVPDIKNKNKAYILPTDVRGTNPKRGIALDDFYARLGELAFGQTTVFLDACFSGVNRDHESVSEGLRGVEIEAEEATLDNGSIVVFSAAQGNETAQGLAQEGHGLFTYFLLKELHDTAGNVSFGKLSDDLTKNVSQTAKQLKLRKSQTPSTNTSAKVADVWRRMRL